MILDLVIILVIAIFTFLGYKKGLVKTAIYSFNNINNVI